MDCTDNEDTTENSFGKVGMTMLSVVDSDSAQSTRRNCHFSASRPVLVAKPMIRPHRRLNYRKPLADSICKTNVLCIVSIEKLGLHKLPICLQEAQPLYLEYQNISFLS